MEKNHWINVLIIKKKTKTSRIHKIESVCSMVEKCSLILELFFVLSHFIFFIDLMYVRLEIKKEIYTNGKNINLSDVSIEDFCIPYSLWIEWFNKTSDVKVDELSELSIYIFEPILGPIYFDYFLWHLKCLNSIAYKTIYIFLWWWLREEQKEYICNVCKKYNR